MGTEFDPIVRDIDPGVVYLFFIWCSTSVLIVTVTLMTIITITIKDSAEFYTTKSTCTCAYSRYTTRG